MKKGKGKVGKIVLFAIQLIIALVSLYPVLFMVLNSLKTSDEYNLGQFSLPKGIYLQNYISVYIRYDILTLFENTIFILVIMLTVSTIISCLAAFAFSKIDFFGSSKLFALVITFMMMPCIVILIPQYYNMSKIGLVNTRLSVILIYIALSLPYSIYLLTVNFRSIPNEVIESANIDGAGFFNTLINIVIPFGKPAMITITILNFTWYWNEFLVAMLFLQDGTKRTMTVGVAMIVSRFNNDVPVFMTGLLLTAIPCIVIYIIFQKYIVKGITAGAIK